MRIMPLTCLLLTGLALTACGDRELLPPPAPVVEVFAPPPPGMFWISGHWFWSGGGYAWSRGYYRHRPYHGAYWNGGYYRHRHGNYVYVEGHW